jgi:single-strand DNA-binding protein
MINRVVLVGRMTRDPELNRTAGGNTLTRFTLALDRNYRSNDGSQSADFIPCVCWNKTAENVAQYCGKGSLVGVEGRIRSNSFTTRDGQRATRIEVQADSVQFLETRAAREKYQQSQQNRVSNDNFYGGNNNYNNNGYGNNGGYSNNNNNFGNSNYNNNNYGNNNYSTQNTNTDYTQNSQPQQPKNNENNNFSDMKKVDVEKDFDDATNSYDIMEDDIQF